MDNQLATEGKNAKEYKIMIGKCGHKFVFFRLCFVNETHTNEKCQRVATKAANCCYQQHKRQKFTKKMNMNVKRSMQTINMNTINSTQRWNAKNIILVYWLVCYILSWGSQGCSQLLTLFRLRKNGFHVFGAALKILLRMCNL